MKPFITFSRATQPRSTGSCSIVGKLLCYHAIYLSVILHGGYTIRSQNILVLLGQLSLSSFRVLINVPVNSRSNTGSSTMRVVSTNHRWWCDHRLSSTYDPMSVGYTQIGKSQQSFTIQGVLTQQRTALFYTKHPLRVFLNYTKHSLLIVFILSLQ